MIAAEKIRTKLQNNGDKTTAYTLTGKPFTFWLTENNNAIAFDKLPKPAYNLVLFDILEDYMKKHGGKIEKGNAHNYKFGHPKCNEHTAVGIIAIEMQKPKIGDSVLDPIFILSAIMDWADIAHNERGYLKLKKLYL